MTTLTLPPLHAFSAKPSARATPPKTRLRSEELFRSGSEELFRSGSELIIEHRGEEYRLKLTRNDKLILNK